MQLPYVLDKVGLQLRMSLTISNVYVPFNKLKKSRGIEICTRGVLLICLYSMSLALSIISFVFNNYVMHYYTLFYNEK
jgi:hypothetical protein